MIHFLRKNFSLLKEELSGYSKREKAFIFFAMLCGFFICCEYSIIRPVSNSLFIHAFSSQFFPYAWLAIVPFNFLIVSLYNRLVPKWGSKKLFLVLVSFIILINCFFGVFCKFFPVLSFIFYMWKEVYILLMFQLLWSVIHANIKLSKAKYLYGIVFGVGGLGSVLGSSFPGFFAISYGSENLIFLTLPVYLLLIFAYLKMNHFSSGVTPTEEKDKKGGFLHGMQLIAKSRFLIFALLIVVFMQMSVAIIDFQFYDFLEKGFGEKDVRTQYAARIFGIVHILTVFFQFIGTYLLIKSIGFLRSHYLIPILLIISSSLMISVPIFTIASLSLCTMKLLDFSIFGVVKEMLYVPLKPDEKFRAKAVIDVFAYRTSKAFASLLILLVQFVVVEASQTLAWINMMIAILWIISVSFGLRQYEAMLGPNKG